MPPRSGIPTEELVARLTSLLSSLTLDDHEASGELKLWRPIDIGQSMRRCLYFSKDADADLQSFVRSESVDRAAGLIQDLTRFAAGRLIKLPEHLKRLKPPVNEIWELRARHPKPQFRLLGGFYSRDSFIVLAAARRDALEKSWNPAIKRVDSEWARLFPSRRRLSGITVEDYATNTDPSGPSAVPD